MTDFTPEQETEIQKRIEEAQRFEQYRIAGMQAFKECELHLSSLIDQYDANGKLVKKGPFDPFVLLVFRQEHNAFVERYFPKKEEEKKADDE